MSTLLKKFQLATEMENTPSGTPGPDDVFYNSTIYNRTIPSNATSFILSSNPDGTGNTYVDDLLNIKVNGNVVFNYDYSHGNSGGIHPIPPYDLTSALSKFAGQTVTIESKFTDLYPNNQGGSAMFLCVFGN